jgi:cytochrome c-type biogenesis protein CcmH
MTLSIALALMGAIAAFSAALIFVVRYGGGPSDLLSLAQAGSARLKELEHSKRGTDSQAVTTDEARVELLRELLAAARTDQFRWWPIRGDRGAIAIIGLAALAMGCFSLLTMIDKAVLTTSPIFAASGAAQDPDLARLEFYVKSRPPRARATAPMSTPPELPDVETMIERLAARLQGAPDDADGWRMLGWSYFHVQQAAKAAEAYARAVALRPQSPELKSAYGEALVTADAGTVTPKATETFNAALALDAGNAKARYYLALAMDQAGKKMEALDAWVSLQAEPLGDEPWAGELRERTLALARELKVDVSGRIPSTVVTQAGSDARNIKGLRAPTAEEIQSVRALPADQQQNIIRGMVSGLAERLEMSPRDEEGWLRLIRSRVVLGEEQAARDALAQALKVFSDDAKAGARIATVARGLGVTN